MIKSSQAGRSMIEVIDDVLSRFGMDDGRQQMSDFFFHDSCCDYNRKDNVYFAE